MTVVDVLAPPRPGTARDRDWLRTTTVVAAVAAVAGWLPFLTTPASPDEGGFLLVASQWGHGSSLYGNHWVDRPPLLLMIHELAAGWGGIVVLRLIGITAVVVSVFLTAAIVRTATMGLRVGRISLVAPVVIAGLFLTTPLFGTTQVDGELLATPFVLAGVLACLRAATAPSRRPATVWALLAGVSATCAVMVKQNAIDVFVLAAMLLLVRIAAGGRRRASRDFVDFCVGAFGALVLILGYAAARGTSPSGLWDAVVTFRFQAAATIHQSASSATHDRFVGLLGGAALSIAPLVIGVLARQVRAPRVPVPDGRRGAPDLRWPAVALLSWEVVSIAGGGSFWLHYLLVLVPGMVVLAVAAAQRPPSARVPLLVVLAAATVSAVVAVGVVARTPPDYASDAQVSTYLREHTPPGETALVTFGHPNILWDAGLDSPYRQLWSLPVRVRDPHLVDFVRTLESARAPAYVVVPGPSMTSWGIDASLADRVLAQRYRIVDRVGEYVIWRRTTAVS